MFTADDTDQSGLQLCWRTIVVAISPQRQSFLEQDASVFAFGGSEVLTGSFIYLADQQHASKHLLFTLTLPRGCGVLEEPRGKGRVMSWAELQPDTVHRPPS